MFIEVVVLMRKSLDITGQVVKSVLDTKIKARKKAMNDILYYLRRLMKLARTVQQLSVLESVESCDMVQEELDRIGKRIDELEKSLRK